MIILLRIVCTVGYYVTKTSANSSVIYWSRDTPHVTTIPQCYWRKLLWRLTRLYRLYIRFGIILTQFYINFSRQEHQIDVFYVSFKTWDSQVSAYTPFHFSFTVPLTLSLLGTWKPGYAGAGGGGGQFDPPPSKSHVWCPNMTNDTSLESSYALL